MTQQEDFIHKNDTSLGQVAGDGDTSPEFIEAEPKGLKAGIRIINLKKMFKTGTGKV